MLFSHAQKTLAWDAFSFAETFLTQPIMVVIGQEVGAFGAYRDGMEIYDRATASADRRLVSLENWSFDGLILRHVVNSMGPRKTTTSTATDTPPRNQDFRGA